MKETQQSQKTGQPGQTGQSGQNISQYLKGANFPADRDELQRTVKRNGAPNDVVERINGLPNQRFNTENDVTNAFSQGGQGGSNTGQGGQGGSNVGQGGQTGGTQGKTSRR